MNLTNIDSVGQDEICKVVSENNFITPKQDTENCKTGDYKEPDYIETNNFTPNVRIDEPKLSADKELDPNNLGEADNESHGRKIGCELFCVTGKDLDYIDIDIIFDDNEMVL